MIKVRAKESSRWLQERRESSGCRGGSVSGILTVGSRPSAPQGVGLRRSRSLHAGGRRTRRLWGPPPPGRSVPPQTSALSTTSTVGTWWERSCRASSGPRRQDRQRSAPLARLTHPYRRLSALGSAVLDLHEKMAAAEVRVAPRLSATPRRIEEAMAAQGDVCQLYAFLDQKLCAGSTSSFAQAGGTERGVSACSDRVDTADARAFCIRRGLGWGREHQHCGLARGFKAEMATMQRRVRCGLCCRNPRTTLQCPIPGAHRTTRRRSE